MSRFRLIRGWSVVLFTVLAIVLVISSGPYLFLSWWMQRDVPGIETSGFLPVDVAFVLRQERGLALEREGDLEPAAKEYEAVHQATSPALKRDADAALSRVLRKLDDPAWGHLIAARRWALAWRNDSWLPMAVVVMALALLNRRRQGWAVAEFEVSGGTGAGLADEVRRSIAESIDSIRSTYETAAKDSMLLAEHVPVPSVAPPESAFKKFTAALSELGDVKVANVGISLEKIARVVRTLGDRNRSHPESGCILNRLPGNPWHFSVNPCSIVNASCAYCVMSLTVVNYRSYKVFINMFVSWRFLADFRAFPPAVVHCTFAFGV